MTTPTTAELLKYADVQMAAEALLTNENGSLKSDLRKALIEGNLHNSVFTATQADAFLDPTSGWTVLAQKPNTATGFSGTLFKNNTTGELVMSFRSTEFVDDAARDNQATNVLEVREFGWAFGQIDDMKQWVDGLYASGKISGASPVSVTGYSLGGHLATAFNLLYPGVPQATYTFNGAGVGSVNSGNLTQVIAC